MVSCATLLSACVALIAIVALYLRPEKGLSPADVGCTTCPATQSVIRSISRGPPSAETLAMDTSAPLPFVRSTDVLIRVSSSALNPVDVKILNGSFKFLETLGLVDVAPDSVPGFDVAGTVVAVGSRVPASSGLAVGAEVFAMQDFKRQATLAEYVAVKHSLVALKPSSMSFAEAASMPLVSVTNWQALVDQGNLKAAETVVILGGSGGCGSNAVQIAAALSANVVATCSAASSPMVSDLGASSTIDYRTQSYDEALLASGTHVDLVYDTVGGRDHYEQGLRVLKGDGRYVTIVGDEADPLTVSKILRVASRIVSRSWPFGSIRKYSQFTASSTATVLDDIRKLVDEGAMRAVIDSEFSFTADGVIAAYERQASSRAKGKVVINVTQ